VQALRGEGLRIDYAFAPTKMNKQFQNAEAQKARIAVVFGSEYPQVAIKDLANRQQEMVAAEDVLQHVKALMDKPGCGQLLA